MLAPQAAISAPHTAVPAVLDAISALQATIVFPIWRVRGHAHGRALLADSGHGHKLLPVVGGGYGYGHKILPVGAGMRSHYLRRYCPLPSLCMILPHAHWS